MIWGIGDIHGTIPTYEGICARIAKEDPEAVTIQVGDMGLGFKGVNMPQVGPNDFFIHGNHDDSLICELSPGFLGDFGVKMIQGKKVFWVCGAASHDKQYRTEGETWWAYEELTYEKLSAAVALYDAERPDIVITHDCPKTVRSAWFGYREEGRTVAALEQMFQIHQPDVWAFGHHHRSKQESICGTWFMCLGEFQYKQLKRPKLADDDE